MRDPRKAVADVVQARRRHAVNREERRLKVNSTRRVKGRVGTCGLPAPKGAADVVTGAGRQVPWVVAPVGTPTQGDAGTTPVLDSFCRATFARERSSEGRS